MGYSTSTKIIALSSIIVVLLTISLANQSSSIRQYSDLFLGNAQNSSTSTGPVLESPVVVVNQFNAYVEFNGVTVHRSCSTTIIVQRSDAVNNTDKIQWTDRPFPELFVGGHSDLLSAQPNLDDVLCLQMGSMVGALFSSLTGPPYAVESVTLLGAQNTERILEQMKEEMKNADDHLEFRVVERKSIVMVGWYKPSSPKVKLARSHDGNSGNFLWEFGATRMINPYTVKFYGSDEDYSAKEEEEDSISALVVATANALHIPRDAGFQQLKNFVNSLSDIVRKVDRPTIVLGIGIQAKFEDLQETEHLQLHEHQVTFMNEIDKRGIGKSVAVRGNITETACRNSNVTNCLSLGCPSLLISRSPDLGQVLENKWNSVASRLSNGKRLKIGMALPAIMRTRDTKSYDTYVDLLLSICVDHECHFILQSGYDQGQFLKYAKMKGMTSITKQSTHHFKTGVENWFEFMPSLDFMVSCRIHGGMAAIVNNVPTIVIPHDYRIMELVNAMMLPHISIHDATNMNVSSLEMLMAVANKDFKAFEANRRDLLREYKRMLESIGLEMDSQLLAIL